MWNELRKQKSLTLFERYNREFVRDFIVSCEWNIYDCLRRGRSRGTSWHVQT